MKYRNYSFMVKNLPPSQERLQSDMESKTRVKGVGVVDGIRPSVDFQANIAEPYL